MSNFPDNADGDVLARLADAGIDLTQPLLLEFAIVAPDEPTALSIEAALAEKGYPAQVEFDEGEPDDGDGDSDDEEFGPIWTVFVAIEMVPEYDEIIRLQVEFDDIAEPLGGRCDGWGVLFDPEEAPDEYEE